MSSTRTAPALPRPAPRPLQVRRRLAVLLVLLSAILALGHRALSEPTSSRPPSAADASGVRSPEAGPGPPDAPPGALGEADGAVSAGTTVFDLDVPGVGRLGGDLRGALQQAATAAAEDGVAFQVDSGWRSAAYQQRLLDEATVEHGSEAAARGWVATPRTSAHVSGAAVDIGPSEAAAWLSGHGAAFGLCQIYANEPWHYELRPAAAAAGCPAMYADPTDDPRTQQR